MTGIPRHQDDVKSRAIGHAVERVEKYVSETLDRGEGATLVGIQTVAKQAIEEILGPPPPRRRHPAHQQDLPNWLLAHVHTNDCDSVLKLIRRFEKSQRRRRCSPKNGGDHDDPATHRTAQGDSRRS